MKPPLWVRLTVVPDRPGDFWLAQLGEHGDAPCGTGSTVPEALESLAADLRRQADHALDRVIRKVAEGVPVHEALRAPEEGS